MSRVFFGAGLLLALIRSAFHELCADGRHRRGFHGGRVLAGRRLDTGATRVLWQQSLRWRMPRALAESYGIMLLVAGIDLCFAAARDRDRRAGRHSDVHPQQH